MTAVLPHAAAADRLWELADNLTHYAGFAAAIDIAREHKGAAAPSILINISGHGMFDLAGYEEAKKGTLANDRPDETMIAASLAAARAKNADLAEALAADARA